MAVLQLPPGAVFNPVINSPYHYIPSQSAAIIMIVLFSLSTLIHTGQAIRFKTWWIFPTAVLCGLMEIGGWGARLWSHSQPGLSTPFKIQICLTILAPTPLLAGTFVAFGKIVERLGFRYSRISPKAYVALFCTSDFVSLVVQGVGGGIASSAGDGKSKGPNANVGSDIILAGIVFQLCTIIAFSICAAEYFYRYTKDLPIKADLDLDNKSENSTVQAISTRGEITKKMKILIGGLSFSTLCLFIRAIYRTIELSDGWSGRIISTQVYFNVLDGAMIILSIWTLNFTHPGLLLGQPLSAAPQQWEDDKHTASI